MLIAFSLLSYAARKAGNKKIKGGTGQREMKMVRRENKKPTNPPLCFQLSHPSCFVLECSAACRNARGHRRGHFESDPPEYGAQMPPYPLLLSFMETSGPNMGTDLHNTFTGLTLSSAAAPL